MSERVNSEGSEKPETFAETLRQGALQETEDLVKFELDVEDLAGREASLINAYLAEDAEVAKAYWQELKDELLLQAEFRASSWLASAASPAVIDWLRLDFCMHRDASQLLSGETAEQQELSCVDCGKRWQAQEPQVVDPCHGCGSEVFAARPLQVQ